MLVEKRIKGTIHSDIWLDKLPASTQTNTVTFDECPGTSLDKAVSDRMKRRVKQSNGKSIQVEAEAIVVSPCDR